MLSRPLIRVVSLSDLHLDHRANWKVAEQMAYQLVEMAPEVLILAGDLASTTERVVKVLEFFRPLAPAVLFVPGNHDLWQIPPPAIPGEPAPSPPDTWQLYRETWPELCKGVGVHYLPDSPWVRGDVAVVGTSGWYDYSLASWLSRQFYTDTHFQEKIHGLYQWVDRIRVSWQDGTGAELPDGAVARIMEADLASQLQSLPPTVENVIAVTHHVPFEESAPRFWMLAQGYFTAFMGSVGLGKILAADPRVHLVIHGHAHVQRDLHVGPIRVVARPLGNPRRDWQGEVAAVAAERMGDFLV